MKFKPYYGWWIVVAAAVGQAVSPGPVAFYSIGVLMKPLAQTYGWDRAQISLIATILTVSIFAMMPFIGAAIDRVGPKKVLMPSLIGFGLALAATGFARSLLAFYAMYVVIGIVCAGANSVAYMRVLATWFDRRRGLAIGAASAGMGVGFALIPAYTQLLIDHGGLRIAFLGLGALILLVGAPVVATLLKDRPRDDQIPVTEFAHPRGTVVFEELPGVTAREAMRMPQFWALLSAFLLVAGAIFAMALHFVSAIRDIDPLHDRSILAAALLGMSATLGRLFSGYLYDKLFVPYVAAGIFSCGATGILLLAMRLSYPWPLVAALLIGYCSGTEGDALAMLCSRYFGVREYGRIYGHAFSATLVGISVIPYLMGLGYEHFHRYTEVEFALAALLSLAAMVVISLGPFPSYQSPVMPHARMGELTPGQIGS